MNNIVCELGSITITISPYTISTYARALLNNIGINISPKKLTLPGNRNVPVATLRENSYIEVVLEEMSEIINWQR